MSTATSTALPMPPAVNASSRDGIYMTAIHEAPPRGLTYSDALRRLSETGPNEHVPARKSNSLLAWVLRLIADPRRSVTRAIEAAGERPGNAGATCGVAARTKM